MIVVLKDDLPIVFLRSSTDQRTLYTLCPTVLDHLMPVTLVILFKAIALATLEGAFMSPTKPVA